MWRNILPNIILGVSRAWNVLKNGGRIVWGVMRVVNNITFFHIIQVELSSIKKQLVQGFSPDDAYPMGPPLFMETPRTCSPVAQIEYPDFDEVNVRSCTVSTFKWL